MHWNMLSVCWSPHMVAELPNSKAQNRSAARSVSSRSIVNSVTLAKMNIWVMKQTTAARGCSKRAPGKQKGGGEAGLGQRLID